MADSTNISDQKKTILIGSSGTGNAFATMLALRRNWGTSCKVIAVDINPKHLITSSLLADKYFSIPEINDPEFVRVIERIISEEDVDTYVPLIDDEIYKAALLYETGMIKQKLNLQVKSSAIADLCNDKYKTFIWLSEQSILTPICYKNDLQISNCDGLIVKPRRGYGSRIKYASEFMSQIANLSLEEYIIQEECKLPEITIDVCFDKNRNFFSYICRERIEVKSGVCTKARLFYDDKLESIAYTIADKLNLSAYCFQVMNYKDNWAVTDINARLGAGSAMSTVVGMDFFSGMFAIFWGEDPSDYFKPLKKESFVTRQYSDFLMTS